MAIGAHVSDRCLDDALLVLKALPWDVLLHLEAYEALPRVVSFRAFALFHLLRTHCFSLQAS